MTKNARTWWEKSRKTLDMPGPPPCIGLSEPAYISFVFEDRCMVRLTESGELSWLICLLGSDLSP